MDLYPITSENLDRNLRNDIDLSDSTWTMGEYFIDGLRRLHIVHSAEHRRGGVVLVGSGSSGQTVWTDAATPDEVLQRYLDDEMIN